MLTSDDVINAYRWILGRDPENQDTIRHYVKVVADQETLRKILIDSQEFNARLSSAQPSSASMDWTQHKDSLARNIVGTLSKPDWLVSTRRYYEAIAATGFTAEQLLAIYRSMGFEEENEYLKAHFRRFYELFGWVIASTSGVSRKPGPTILEIGSSHHTTYLYKRVLPCSLFTLCRPTSTGGPDEAWAKQGGSEKHLQFDLNEIKSQGKSIDQAFKGNAFDVIICTEVVEHLTVPPRDVFERFLRKLKPKGRFYISTPNYLTPANLVKTFGGVNPAATFEGYQSNVNMHHHFREYTPLELIREVELAGGLVKEVVFSNCWAPDKHQTQDEIPFRSNLILIASKAVD